MKPIPSEFRIIGKWEFRDGRVLADDACARIQELVQNYLRELGHDPSGWDTLFVDPQDGRLWELTYPNSQEQGGGAPALCNVTVAQAKSKYGRVVPGPS